jgi:hypothetical protein
MTEEELAPMAVVIAVAAFLFIAISVLVAICCLQRRRRNLLAAATTTLESQKANNKKQGPPPSSNFRGRDDIQIAANKMEDLLQQNTQQLLQGACVNSNLYVESGHNNHEYEVPHNERSCYGYYDLRDGGRSAALR